MTPKPKDAEACTSHTRIKVAAPAKLAKCRPVEILVPATWKRWGWAVEAVSKRYGVPVRMVLGSDRNQLVSAARRDLYLSLYGSGLGYSEIARLLGVDHTSVMFGVKKSLA